MEAIGTGAAANVSSETVKGIFHQVKRHIRYVIFYQKIVDNVLSHRTLIAKRTSVQQDVDVAERNGEKSKADVLDWSHRVEKVVTEQEKKVKDLEVKAKTKCFFGLCPKPNIKSRYQLSRKAEEAAATFDELIKDCQFERLGYRDVPEPIVHTDFEAFKSREEVFNDIMESLKDATTGMIGVYGMAGVGKTSLVNEVERQLHDVKLFDSVVRAIISRIPDIKEVQDQMAYSLGLKLEENSPVKNVLIILDDLWKKLDLAEVGIPFGSQHKGCKILLTSRYQNVLSNGMDATKTFAIGDLDDGEAWEFFKKMAGDTKKCARLPLALATVARALRNRSLFVWRDALQQLQRPYLNKSSCEISAEVHLAIELSINLLSSEDLKQIFLLCSLLRRDTRIEDLLRYACGLGLIKGVNTMKAARDRLLKIMSTLKESCLLLDSKSTNEEYFDVHDITYIVAKSIVSKDNQVLALTEEDNDEDVVTDWPNGESMKECNKIILQNPSINKLPDQLNCPQLFLFLLFSEDLSLTLPDNFFKEAENLTIIGALKNLNVLSLLQSDIKIVPKEIGQLLKLKLLDVSGCTKPEKVSADVLPRLSKLEELYRIWFPFLEKLQLSSLNVTRVWHNQLSNVSFYTHDKLTTLIIEDCGNIKYLLSFSMAKYLVHLKYFEITKCNCLEEIIFWEDIEEEIQATMTLSLFPQLQSLELKDLQHLSGFCFSSQNKVIEFPFMKSMTIYNCPNLEGFISRYTREGNQRISSQGDLFDNKVAFPKLQHLTVEGCDKLLTIFPSNMLTTFRRLHQQQVFEIMHEEEETTLLATAQLRELYIRGLPKLKYIWKNDPKGIFSFKKICAISVMGCRSLKNVFPASVAKDLPHLGYPSIFDCGVEEIVSKLEEGSESETAVNFEFDQLYTLILSRLPELKYIYPGKHTAKWPMLNELEVAGCEKLNILGTQLNTNNGQLDSPIHPPLFLVEKVIPKLQLLTLDTDYIAMISDSQFSSSLFHEIKSFRVVGHGAKSIDFRISFLERFYTLENLTISYYEIKELFCTEGDTGNEEMYAGTLSTIRNLKLVALNNLKDNLWKQDVQVDHILPKLETLQVHFCCNLICLGSSSASFQNLTTLDVQFCETMEYLDTCLAIQGMAQLKKLMVRDCISMTEIVATEGDEATCDIIFSSFCSGNHTFGFPCLEELIVSGCPELEIFCMGVLTHPPLLAKCGYDNEHWCSDLNNTIQEVYSIKAEFSKSIEIWKNMHGSLDFKKLKVLEVNYLVSLPLLKDSTIVNMGKMERIWNDQLEMNSSKLKHLCMAQILPGAQ
ncbi:hypothetical protein ES288_A11G303900v1 [Gossypium darwinii]|uniref:Uncharacterized protein n=1 Tax=Gossypium darwinii TaxID=34276 RepID=A0A5D2EQE3_GOSDA|nr:hypothetical protein ES288_A11G303900v1 [Gossypium darwinii]